MDPTIKKAKSIKNAEKRRERSKVAARCRRGKESEIFNDLSESLPIPESTKSALDKASVMRLTLCNLGIKKIMNSGFMNDMLTRNSTCTEIENEFESQVNQAFGGFILVFGLDGDVIYASEGVTAQLGISQYEIMGQSIYEFSHQLDHHDIRCMLKEDGSGDELGIDANKRSCIYRMKCTASSRGKNSHLRSANYKVVNCIGRMVQENGTTPNNKNNKWFVAVCEPLTHPSDVDIPLNKQSFLSKHSLDMKFEYVDEAVSTLLGYTREEMMGRSLFEFNHAADGAGMANAFKSLYDKEQNQTDCYRFLTKGGGWIWVMTQATVIHGSGASSNKNSNSVVCIHFVISEREEEDQVLSQIQIGERVIPSQPVSVPTTRTPLMPRQINANPKAVSPTSMTADEENTFIADLLVGPLLNQATCSTAKIFAPKTKDMDTGFLMPVNVDGHGDKLMIVDKEVEPEDLTHLAPIAGDECVSLDVPMLEDLLASLDEGEVAYSFLDEEEIAAFEAGQEQQQKLQDVPKLAINSPIPPDSNYATSPNSSPMMLGVDPVMVSGGVLSPLMFNNSPVSATFMPNMSLSPIPAQQGQDVGYVNGGGGTVSPIPPDLDMDVVMETVQQSPQDGVRAWINSNLQNGEKRLHYQQESATAGQEFIGASGGPPPNKVQKLVSPAPGMVGHIQVQQDNGTGSERMYILVPVRMERRQSSSSSSSESDSGSSRSSQGGQIDLIDLVRAQQLQIQRQTQINNQLMNRMAKVGGGRRGSISNRKRNFAGSLLGVGGEGLSFHELTRQDCEVNAPLSQNADLLMGPELLQALDSGATAIAI